MKTNHYFKRSFLALFALLPLSLMAQTPSLESVTMETPWDGAALNCFDSITLTADVEVLGSADVTVDFFVDGRRINETPVTASEMSPGEFRAITTWNSPYIGNHSIYAQAYMSTGGTQRSASVNVEVFGVGSAPEIVLSVPDGDHRVIGSNARFYVHAGDSGALINTLYFYVNGVVYDTISDASALGSFPYSFDFHFPAMGSYEIWVIAESSNGNRGISNIINMEIGMGSPPSVALISPIDGAQFLPGTALPILAQTNDPDSLILGLQYFVNDTLIANATRNNDGSYTIIETSASTLNYTYQFPFAGDYRIYVQATDGSGIIAQSNIVTVMVRELDPTKPQVIMSHPLPVGGGDTVNDVSIGSSMFLNAIATDGDGYIKYVKFFINGQEIGWTVTQFRNTFSLFFRPTTPGAYIIFAEAVDNHNKHTQSVPLQLNVYALEAQLPIVTMLPLAPDVVDAGTQITMQATADGGLVEVSQVNFYVNGVFVGGTENPNESEIYEDTIILNTPGTYTLNARAIEIDPLGLTTDNWVISDAITVKVEGSSSNRGFVSRAFEDMIGYAPSQTYVDQQVVSIDLGQKSQAQFIYELMQRDDFFYTENSLMARYLLTGAWPNRSVLMLDRATIGFDPAVTESYPENLETLVENLMPTFQINYWDGRRIPDGFSSDSDFEDFARVLFNNKYGQNPNGDQIDQCVWLLRPWGAVAFVSEFIKDNEAVSFGSGTRSMILGIPNPPNTRLLEYARAASLYINLARITPNPEEVAGLSGLPLIQQIETVLADPRYTSR